MIEQWPQEQGELQVEDVLFLPLCSDFFLGHLAMAFTRKLPRIKHAGDKRTNKVAHVSGEFVAPNLSLYKCLDNTLRCMA